MKYAVTGAAGFIGSQLAEALHGAGHEVVGIDSFTDYYDPALKERNARGLDVRRLDLARDELDFAGCDGVFHLAGQPGVRSFGDVFPLYLERNVLASQRVFEAAAAAGARVVFSSSSSIYGEAERYPTAEDVPPRPVSPYGITKLACEHLARAYLTSFGLDAVVLRYFNAYGPRQRPDMAFPRILDALASGGPFALFGDGEQSRSFTFVADVVAASHPRDGARPVRLDLQRRRRRGGDDEPDDRPARVDRRPGARRPPRGGGGRRPAPHEGRHLPDSRRARLGAGDAAGRGPPGAVGVGFHGTRDRVARVNAPDPDAEREVDLRSAWSRLAARWWLPLLGLLLGLVVGYVLALGGGSVHEGNALVYVGQPLTPGGSPIQSIATTPKQVGEIVRSEAALREASRKSGIPVGKLRGRVATQAISPGVQGRLASTLLVQIKVQGDSAPRKIALASNALAAHVVSQVSDYPDLKIASFRQRLEGINARLESVAERIAALEDATEQSQDLPPLERLELISLADNAEQRRGQLLDQQTSAQQFLALAESVERARIVEEAVAVGTTAQSGRNAALVGGLIGLLLGCVAALLADPFLARRAGAARV